MFLKYASVLAIVLVSAPAYANEQELIKAIGYSMAADQLCGTHLMKNVDAILKKNGFTSQFLNDHLQEINSSGQLSLNQIGADLSACNGPREMDSRHYQ